jgi:uncharacterized LabA/DUF88 family protein
LWQALRGMSLKNRRLDYIKLKEYLVDGRTADVRFYYGVVPESMDVDNHRYAKEEKFYKGIEAIGYMMICLPVRDITKACLSCEIVYDMALLSRTGAYKSFILVAGDEDYARTVRRIRSETGMVVEVAFFSQVGCATTLVKEASRFIDLSDSDVNSLFREYRQNGNGDK